MSRKRTGKRGKAVAPQQASGGKTKAPQQANVGESKPHRASQKADGSGPKPDRKMPNAYALAVFMVTCILILFYFSKTILAKITFFDVPTSNLLAAIEIAVMTAIIGAVIIHHIHHFSAFFSDIFDLPQKHQARGGARELVVVAVLLMCCGIASMAMIICSELLLGDAHESAENEAIPRDEALGRVVAPFEN